MPNYELPNNDTIEKMLEKNTQSIPSLKMKEKKGSGKNYLFPFWTPVANEGADVITDYDKFLSARDSKKRELKLSDDTGAVKATSAFDDASSKYEDNTIMGQMNKIINKVNSSSLEDMTGIVKPDSTEKVKQIIKQDSTTEYKEKSNASSPKKDDLTGIVKPKAEMKTVTVDFNNNVSMKTVELGTNNTVKPKSEGMPKGTTKQVTDVDTTKVNKVEVDSNASKGKENMTGAVKPKAEGMPKGTTKQETKVETKVETEVDSNASKAKGDRVGSVKGKTENLAKPKEINFDKYK